MVTSKRFYLIHLLILLALMLLLSGGNPFAPSHSVYAQSNLLQNPGFDGSMTGQPGIPGVVPTGWRAWGSMGDSDRETLSALTRSAPNSWRLRKEFGRFTGGGYQTVSVQSGTTYRFSIFAMIWTCNDEEFACRGADTTYSDTSSGGRVRVGIDPTGGTDPFSGNIRWSGFASPFNWSVFAGLSVEARASNNQITVFTYYTADQDMRWHDVFWDDASLVATGSSGGNNNGGNDNGGNNNDGGSDNNDRPRPTAAPVVADSRLRSDGAQVHEVKSGQYLSTIARAYNLTLDQLLAINPDLTVNSIIRPGDEIIVKVASATSTPPPATARPTSTPLQNVTVTPLVRSTAAAFAATATPTPGQAVVNVDDSPADSGVSDTENDTTRRIVTMLAVMVIVSGAIVGTAVIGFTGFMMLRR